MDLARLVLAVGIGLGLMLAAPSALGAGPVHVYAADAGDVTWLGACAGERVPEGRGAFGVEWLGRRQASRWVRTVSDRVSLARLSASEGPAVAMVSAAAFLEARKAGKKVEAIARYVHRSPVVVLARFPVPRQPDEPPMTVAYEAGTVAEVVVRKLAGELGMPLVGKGGSAASALEAYRSGAADAFVPADYGQLLDAWQTGEAPGAVLDPSEIGVDVGYGIVLVRRTHERPRQEVDDSRLIWVLARGWNAVLGEREPGTRFTECLPPERRSRLGVFLAFVGARDREGRLFLDRMTEEAWTRAARTLGYRGAIPFSNAVEGATPLEPPPFYYQ